jgi:hypothetical protein
MARHRYDDRDHRWLNRDDESRNWEREYRNPRRENERGRWRRGDWESRERYPYEGRPRSKWDESENWMTYGRPEEDDWYGTRRDDPDYGFRVREEWNSETGYGSGWSGRSRRGAEIPWRGRPQEEDWEGGFSRMGDRDYDRWRDEDWVEQGRPYGRGLDRDFDRMGGPRSGGRWRSGWNDQDRDYDRGYDRMEGRRSGLWSGEERDRYERGRMGRPNDDVYVENPYDYDYDDIDWTYTEVWMIEGPYTGYGPQGYQRSDKRICEDVCERLTYHGQLDPSEVEVEVDNGEVTLKGRVSDRRSKRIAEDVAATVSGVVDVHNQIRVDDSLRQEQDRRVERYRGYSGEYTEGYSDRRAGRQGERRWERSALEMESLGRDQIRKGMQVFGTDDSRIGEIKEIRQNDFLVDRPMARDVYVPFHACEHVSDDRVRLNIPAGEVNNQGWPNPELVDNNDNT